MEMTKNDLYLSILCEIVCKLRGKKDYKTIMAMYDRLLENNLIHSIEDFKAGMVVKGSAEESLIYWIWRALVQAESNQILNPLIPDEMKDTPCTLEELNYIF